MKRMIFALCVLPFASHAMHDSIMVRLSAGEFMQVALLKPDNLDNASKEKITTQMQEFTNLFLHPTFMSDLLEHYRDCLLSTNQEKIDGHTFMKAKIGSLMAKQSEQQENNSPINDKRRTAEQLAAAHCVSALLDLQQLK